MNIKKGFTLAEILISLTVVGVVAALVLPRVMTDISNQAAGPALGRAMEILQNGSANILSAAQENSDDDAQYYFTLSAITVGDLFGQSVNGVATNTPITNSNYVISLAGNFFGAGSMDGLNYNSPYAGTVFRLGKSNMIGTYSPVAIAANAGEDAVIARVYVDVNGTKRPNRAGEDIFLYGLTNRGLVIPAGSEAYRTFDNAMPLASAGCAGSNPANGLSCTAKILSNKLVVEKK